METLYTKWLRFAKEDEQNMDFLGYLTEKRNGDTYDEKVHLSLANAGIIGSPDPTGDFFLDFLDSIGETMESIGYGMLDPRRFGDGFIIPSWSTSGKLLFCVNHNKERASGLDAKYINLYPDGQKEYLSNFRFYGLENSAKALEQGYMVVCEGIFDKIRLESEGLPAMTTLGSQISKTQLRVLNRFDKIKLVGDNDRAGRQAQQLILKSVPRAEQFNVTYEKDIDDLAIKRPDIYKELIDKIKKE